MLRPGTPVERGGFSSGPRKPTGLGNNRLRCGTANSAVEPAAMTDLFGMLLLEIISEFPKLCLPPHSNQLYIAAVPSQTEGRLAIVTNAGRDAVDASGALDDSADADGEVVWS